MRLIKADEVKKYIHNLMLNNADKYTDKEMAQYVNLIDACQTVKAVPIEWMKNYARKICANDGGRYNSKAYGIDRMIYDWEKENETEID